MQTEVQQLDDNDAFSEMTKEEQAAWVTDALRRPDDFGYRGGNDEMFHTWSLGPALQHRDSDLRDKSNAKAIVETLESDPSLKNDWCVASSGHWAVGWIEQLSFRVLDGDGSISRVARVIKGIYNSLEEYPLLDEQGYYDLESDATIANIDNHYKRNNLKDGIPDDWAYKMYIWFNDHDEYYEAIENSDDRGGYPSEKHFEECARALGFWDTEEDEDDE